MASRRPPLAAAEQGRQPEQTQQVQVLGRLLVEGEARGQRARRLSTRTRAEQRQHHHAGRRGRQRRPDLDLGRAGGEALGQLLGGGGEITFEGGQARDVQGRRDGSAPLLPHLAMVDEQAVADHRLQGAHHRCAFGLVGVVAQDKEVAHDVGVVGDQQQPARQAQGEDLPPVGFLGEGRENVAAGAQ